jgi:membrane protease YdiL (CAAX protease family)
MTTFKDFIKRHALLTYFVLTFALSWGSLLLVVGPGFALGATEIPEAQLPFVYLAMLVGPCVAGLLLTGLVAGRTGLRQLFSRLLQWRVGVRWYAVALLTAPLLYLVVLLALSLRSPVFAPVIFTSDNRPTLVLIGIAVGLLVGFLEEFGWTGFAVPRLRQRYAVLTTGLLVGLLWGAWHFLLFHESDSFSAPLALVLLLVQLFAWLPAYRVLMVWVYDRTESLLVAMLMHASLVATQDILVPLTLTGIDALTYLCVWAAALWATVAVVAVVNRGQSTHPPLYQEVGAASR